MRGTVLRLKGAKGRTGHSGGSQRGMAGRRLFRIAVEGSHRLTERLCLRGYQFAAEGCKGACEAFWCLSGAFPVLNRVPSSLSNRVSTHKGAKIRPDDAVKASIVRNALHSPYSGFLDRVR